MYLINPKIKYKNDAGSWTDLPALIACDPGFVNRPGRPLKGATGLYTTKFLDDVRAIYTSGSVASIDKLIPGDRIELQVWDGSKWIQATFNVSSNIPDETQPNNRVLIISAIPEIAQSIITEGGSGSEVTKSYVDNGDANTLSSAESYADTKVADKLDKATTTSGLYSYIRNNANDTTMSIGQSSAAKNTIVARTGTGTIITADPTADNEASTKKYVDDKVVAGGTSTLSDAKAYTDKVALTKITKTGDKVFKVGLDSTGLYFEEE